MSIPIDHQLVKRFVSQVRNEDFSIEIEKLIDPISWKQIFRICKGRNRDENSISQTLRLEQILQLQTYVFKKEDEVINLDTAIWCKKTICNLLLDCYPESTSASTLGDSIAQRMVAILPKFDLDRPTIEQEFVRKVDVLQAELGDDITIPAA
jgi:hypothetical protein